LDFSILKASVAKVSGIPKGNVKLALHLLLFSLNLSYHSTLPARRVSSSITYSTHFLCNSEFRGFEAVCNCSGEGIGVVDFWWKFWGW
jgi:hypothetical protein